MVVRFYDGCDRAALSRVRRLKSHARRLPVAHRRRERGAQHESGLFQGQSAEEPQFGDPGFTLIERGQLVESVMEIEHVNVAPRALRGVGAEGHASPAPGPLCHLMGARPIDEDTPHHLARHREELRTVLPDGAILIDEAKVDLVHERRRLKCFTSALTPKERRRSPSELTVHRRDQLIPRLEVALVPCLEKGGDIDGPVHRRVEAIAAVSGRSCVATHIDVCFARRRRLPIAIGDSVVRGIDRVDP